MITVSVYKQSNYPASVTKIKKSLVDFFIKSGIVSDAEVSVALVSEKKMGEISRKYLKESEIHDVLSFTAEETREKFIYPDSSIHLGEIVVCFPKVFEEVKKEGKLIDEKVIELVEHGARHLMVVHHEYT